MLMKQVISKDIRPWYCKKFKESPQIVPGDVSEWIDNEKGITVAAKEKRTLKDISAGKRDEMRLRPKRESRRALI